jgi:acetyl esterase/lipase
MKGILALTAALLIAPLAAYSQTAPFDAAAAFGALPSVSNLSLSPDGNSVAYMVPTAGQGSTLYSLSLAPGATPKPVLSADGTPNRIGTCHWVTDDRLVCGVFATMPGALQTLRVTRVIAVDANGGNAKTLSNKSNNYTRGFLLGGGEVIDWLPDENGAVLMTRDYLPDDHVGTRIASTKKGLAVDRVDTRTLAVKSIELPNHDAVNYITDGRGTVRIMAFASTKHSVDGYESEILTYFYRLTTGGQWQKLSELNTLDGNGFRPLAVDHDLNVAYGFKKLDGRMALYAIALDKTLKEQLVFSRPDVDVDGLQRIGRRRRVIGATYSTDFRHPVFFDADIQRVLASLGKALPKQPLIDVLDSSVDESKLLIRAGSDQDPGVYYLFDRKSHHLDTFLVVRKELEGVKLAAVKAVTYPAADGTLVPGYLTLPPGKEDAKGLPAIVMPHGGPAARDEWGFDWLAQFYAARGYAVLQPNFRGSSGYGDAWFMQNGFKSWRVAIGDVIDAGHWLVSQGIADPNKLGIVGWSYGGYAALQSAVVDPLLFKAVVAIAPVTDLALLKEEHRDWSDFAMISTYVGDGPHIREGSPAMNADKIKAPVLMFQGGLDINVNIRQSREMAERLASAGAKGQLIVWDNLDHQLEDSAARTELLRKSDAFLRQAFGM